MDTLPGFVHSYLVGHGLWVSRGVGGPEESVVLPLILDIKE